MQESIVFLVRVQCRRKESSRSLSHLLMSFLFFYKFGCAALFLGFSSKNWVAWWLSLLGVIRRPNCA